MGTIKKKKEETKSCLLYRHELWQFRNTNRTLTKTSKPKIQKPKQYCYIYYISKLSRLFWVAVKQGKLQEVKEVELLQNRLPCQVETVHALQNRTKQKSLTCEPRFTCPRETYVSRNSREMSLIVTLQKK